jgi:MoaA/NifB/PqqE/SkfB family radical SAM enzyme
VHGKNLYNDAIDTLFWFKQYKHIHQRIRLNFILCEQNWHELEEWKYLFREFEQLIKPVFDAGDIKPASKQALGKRSLEDALAQSSYPQNKKYDGLRPCPCWDSLNISYRGEIMHCMDLPYSHNYGSVYNIDIEDVWKKRNMIGLDYPGCRNCRLKDPDWKRCFC